MRDGFRKEMTCLTIPAIADLVPSEIFPRNSLEIPSNIKLADPHFHLPQPVDLLIGSGATLSLFSIGQINLSRADHDLYLQKTRLGWVVAGSTSAGAYSKTAICHLTNLEKQITKFWTVEEIEEKHPNTREEIECETHFMKTIARDADGRYIVSLPFRNTSKRLGESRSVALKRLLALERKFDRDATFKAEYARAFNQYLTSNHISVAEDLEDDGYYMPHHAIFKNSSETTKIRIVFDASAKTNTGMSLNEALMMGPTIQNALFAHLIRFRTYKYAMTADIEKMYLQVLVHESERRFQRILWRKDGEIKTFQLNTLAFGIASSPFLAIRTLQRLAEDERHAFPEASEVLKIHLYVDNLLSGANTIDEARLIRDNLSHLLARGGFNIRQWASNDERIINDLPTRALHTNLTLDADSPLKTLGIIWSIRSDEICYTTNPISIADRLTKRNVLSAIAKIFDPLGLLGPVVLYAKKIMQDVWRAGIHWDESVPECIYSEWLESTRQLDLIEQITFSRRLLIDDCREVQIHGFCDASNIGYGACLYVRSKGECGATISTILCAKSRVAPLKTITLSRLEFCGASLLAHLYREVSSTLNIVPSKTVFWSDSTIVLHWLKTSPHSLKTFVANRVTRVQELTSAGEWRHVRSEDNPADAMSRGQLPHVFAGNRAWFAGPSWLVKDESEWPAKYHE